MSKRDIKGLKFKKRAPKTTSDDEKKSTTQAPLSVKEKGISFDMKEDLEQFLNSHLETELIENMDPNKHELEFRIGSYFQRGKSQVFDAYVSRLNFNRMIKYYHEKYERVKMEESVNLDVIVDDTFRVTVGGDNLNSSKTEVEFFCRTNKLRNPTFLEKVQIVKSDNPDWHYRLTSSQESPITNRTQQLKLIGQVEDKSVSKFYRYKHRYSYFPSDEIRVDFTVIKETPYGRNAGTLVSSRTLAQREKYQVELEYIGINFSVENLTKVVQKHLNNLIHLYNGTKGSDRTIIESHSDLILSRYLEMGLGRRLTKEQIYQKPTTTKFLAVDVEALTRENFNRILTDYMVTLKADGEHYLLYCDKEYGFYLINNRLSVSPVSLNVPSNTQDANRFKEKISELGNCLFDGELVEHDGKTRFLIFDCFFFNGRDVRDFPLYARTGNKYVANEQSRIYYIKQLTSVIENDLLKDHLVIEEKNYYHISRVGRFFKRESSDSDKWVMDEDSSPYYIDGLIYMPISEGYPKVQMRGGRIIKTSSLDDPENVSPILKWKPAEFLSVDFRVKFQLNGDNTPKIIKRDGKDYQVMTLESAYGNKIYPFEPTCYRVKDYNITYIQLKGGQPVLQERDGYRVEEDTLGHVIRNNDILEFVWIPDRSWGSDYWGMWFPIKYREDKTSNGFPNNYRKVADRTWLAIHDRQILPDNLMDPTGQQYPSPQLDLGYYQNKNRDVLPHLRNIHNAIKSVLLFLSIKQSGSRSRRLMDLATGRGGDFGKWAGINYALGIEFDEANLKSGDASAFARYRKMIEASYRNDRRSQFTMDLIQGDMREPFDEGRISSESIFNHILKERLNRNRESFGIISCQFAIHYACDTEEHIDTFFKNVSENLAPNGYFIATAFDGSRVLNDLQTSDKLDEDGQPVLIGKSGNSIVWSIAAPVKYRTLENVGQKIMVFNKTIKDEEEVEYLVNFNYLIEVARKYRLFPGQLSFGKHTLPMDGGYGIGGFSDIYEDNFLKLVGDTTFPKGSPKYRDLSESYSKIPLDVKRYSKYSSYLILRKQTD